MTDAAATRLATRLDAYYQLHVMSHVTYILPTHVPSTHTYAASLVAAASVIHCMARRGGGLGSRPIFKKFNEPYAPS